MLKEELEITASLAYLHLSETEMGRFSESVERMLGYFETMDRMDVDGLEPTIHALLAENKIRTDNPAPFNNCNNNNFNNNENSNAELLNNVPESEGRLISIPNIL
jgi:aspartyl-tRNA(Asn)/glutamyl-tRNA(Gln) amidotransferase subunit C